MGDLQFRFHRGGLAESLCTLFKPKSWDDFEDHCAAYGLETSNITTKLYDGKPDTRVGWRETWIVCNANGPIGFANGDITVLRK
jgi:hypothetical protein